MGRCAAGLTGLRKKASLKGGAGRSPKYRERGPTAWLLGGGYSVSNLVREIERAGIECLILWGRQDRVLPPDQCATPPARSRLAAHPAAARYITKEGLSLSSPRRHRRVETPSTRHTTRDATDQNGRPRRAVDALLHPVHRF